MELPIRVGVLLLSCWTFTAHSYSVHTPETVYISQRPYTILRGQNSNIKWPVHEITIIQFNSTYGIFDDVTDSVSGAIDDVKDSVSGAIDTATGTVDKVTDSITGTVDKVTGTATGWVDKVTGVLDSANGWVSQVETISGGIGGAISGIGGAVAGVINAVQGIKETAHKREELKIQQEQFEREMDVKITSLCDTMCVTEWSHWAMCGSRCGGGTTTRSRARYESSTCEGKPCRHALEETTLCNTGCPNNGIPVEGGGACACPAGFTGQCCENEARCEYPGMPKYGQVDGTFPAKYGNVASYKCNDGFALVGDSYQICMETGEWRGDKPTCERIKCQTPGEPRFGILINKQTSYLFNDEAAYMCMEGYTLVGPKTRKCRSMGEEVGRWTGFAPMCLPISCGPPNLPLHGNHVGTEYTLGSVVQYSCQDGFMLIGSEERICLPSGHWSGHETICRMIECEEPYAPDHGKVLRPREKYEYGRTVRFACDKGYLLEGSDTAKCVVDPSQNILGQGGLWDTDPPTCKAVICGDPGDVDNSAKSGNIYYYPHYVTYTCFPGHIMIGDEKLQCESNGRWNAQPPVCEACPHNTYQEETQCLPCPGNSHTVTPAAVTKEQCVCDVGYKENGSGECVEITCPELDAPENGQISQCRNKFNEECEFSCDSGHILERGSSKRVCTESGQWSGGDATCSGCPRDTYQSDERACIPCPRYSHTLDTASTRDQCLCDDGFTLSGEDCVDVNECQENDGKGPCSDKCENTVGSYRCLCTIPGYIIDPLDRNTCIVDKQCRNLTETDAPSHGGLVCHWYWEENSQQCSIRCNPGYEFPTRVNNYETCGPTTGFFWTHEERDEQINPCLEEFFPEFKLEAESAYFVQECKKLTDDEKSAVKEEFAQTLTEQGVCIKRDTQVCRMEDVGIICGHTLFSTFSNGKPTTIDSIDFTFKVKALQIENKTLNCAEVCKFLNIKDKDCDRLCVPAYKRFLRGAVLYSQSQLKHIFKKRSAVSFKAASRKFVPQRDPLRTSDVEIECPPGMMTKDDMCVPCHAGTYKKPAWKECQMCPRMTHQPDAGSDTCVRCPTGSETTKSGQSQCTPCASGRWGEFCRQKCGKCIHGSCSPVSGVCICRSGWEGQHCDVDKDGCAEGHDCPAGTQCKDVPAPGVGYTCV